MTRSAAPPPPDLSERPEWVRYRLQKGEIVLTFRVPKGTPMVMEQAGWEVEGAVIGADVRQPYEDALREFADAWDQWHLQPVETRFQFRRLTLARDAARSLLSDTEASRP